MGFSIQDYLKNNKIELGSIKKEVGDTPYKGGHNDIRKTNYDVKIKEDGKLDLYTHKTIMTEGKSLIKEASEIKFNELDSTKQKKPTTFDGSQSRDADGQIISYQWDFGDGNTSSEINPSHIYIQNGTFNISLTVTNSIGIQTLTQPALFTINRPDPPIATDDSSCGPGNITLIAQSSGTTQWYTDSIGGVPMFTGDTLLLGLISTSEHYYVESNVEPSPQFTGKPDNSGGGGYSTFTRSGGGLADFNRLSDDGELIAFYQDTTKEGNITVSGTTVSYNGGHLARYAQTTTAKDESLVKGTVLSNLDAMNVYTDAEGNPVANEQLNKVKVSDVEGDANVAGVFVNWSYDEQHSVDEINMAMTGDMIIRIAQGVTVVRGDLLMSAGDGTAKPQGDDIVRSKTVAKVTSNHITCTYADGSYCVPCVLMAC